MSKREFHFIEGTSNKFWAISLFKNSYTVTYGRIGTIGQSKTKELATPDEAQKAHDGLIQTKLREGYTEITTANGSQINPTPAISQSVPATKAAPVITTP